MARKLLTLRKRNQITLPNECILENVTQFQCEIQEDGSILLIPQTNIPVNQLYFWTKRWQEGEKEASEDILHGRVEGPYGIEELIAEMNKRRQRRQKAKAS